MAGAGIYARAFCPLHPDLPVEEDGRLNDPVLRENFLTRVFAYSAWQQLRQEGLTRRGLTDFHSRYKYLLMAHNPVQYKTLGNLLGNMGHTDPQELGPRYFSELMAALKKCATRRTHTNVLQHLSGYLKQAISARRQAGSAARDQPVPPGHRAAGGAADTAQTSLSPTPGSVHRTAGLPATAPGKPQPAKRHLMKKALDTSAREDLGDDFKKALDEGWLPIREVARQTGVNAVTLRAWERRYGLIVPQRTPKGHRLFSAEHVQRIQTILTWLNRGVAVSQVKPLLDTPQAFSESVENDWHALLQTLLQAVSRLQERALDDSVNQAMALYPPRTLCEQLLMPLLADLEQRWQGQFGAQMERGFFCAWLRSKFGARIYHNNRQLRTAPLLLVNHSDLPWNRTCGSPPG